MPQSDCLQKVGRSFSLLRIGVERPCPLEVVNTRQVVLSYIRKQAEQAIKLSIHPCLNYCLQVSVLNSCLCFPYWQSKSQTDLLISMFLSVMAFCHINRNPTKTVTKGEKHALIRFVWLKECRGTEEQYGVCTPRRRHETPYMWRKKPKNRRHLYPV